VQQNQQQSKERFILHTGNEKLNNFLTGGFIQGNIYEITGASLSGKSYFLNKLIARNFHNLQKIIFFDLNDSFNLKYICNKFSISKEKLLEKIEVIKIIDFHSLVHALKEIFNSITNKNYVLTQKINFIFIDSLSLIANRMTLDKSKDNDMQTEFNQILNSFMSQYKIGIIFTTCPIKIKDKQFFDFCNPGSSMILKESESSLAGAIVLPIDYSLSLINPRFNYRREGINCRKFLCKVKSEKIHPLEELIEITNID
jgi:archaellum biogenesis ATPase FlaH